MIHIILFQYLQILKRVAEDNCFKKLWYEYLNLTHHITFDKNYAGNNPDMDFVSFGHPLLECVITWVENNYVKKITTRMCF